ncbi:MAG: monovalent cation:proton antiporter-2 (CPA2) family protein [Gemmatimonas sp.]|jgi:monovalent cation:proton antiporter-2 (CPA2) family protein|uniref:monovalent cation:proton antiporter-2 (CPA2) family protein n=1 Tax=Gemmatimonas sp. TaxID=1962908 RepID=UPI00391F902E|nr:monovalent cation:proton antiporter-2 (CPA2) family protein [Gemmatimonadota bacterium]
MNDQGFFFQAFAYLAAAVVAVPIAKRLGLGSVLGYLLAGVAIGPFALGLIGREGQDIMHFAEFGVVMMLFLVGLELELSRLWALRGILLGMGGLQVLGTAAAIVPIGLALGQSWQVSVAAGLILSLSSTAIVLQSLQEKGVMKTLAGERAFAVLLFQDLAVIPMLAVLPLLAPTAAAPAATGTHPAWITTQPGWVQAVATLAAVAGVVASGRFVVRPVFRIIARTHLRELFTAASLLLVIGIALVMQAVGLSAALGTFLAGVVLADSEFRHELVSDVEPFKGLLLGLFFLAVGASIDFALIAEHGGTVAGLVIGVVVLKAAVLGALARGFRMGREHGLLFSLALAQGGEFCFVLLSYASQQQIMNAQVSGLLVATVALSMALTPALLLLYDTVLQPRLTPVKAPASRAPDVVGHQGTVIIAGFGQFGSTVGRLLRANGVRPVVLDVDSDRVDVLRRIGLEVYFGDASRLDLLHTAGASNAAALVIAIGDAETALEIARTARTHFPQLRILARAENRPVTFDLLELGIAQVYRDTLDTALRVGVDALRAVGVRAHRAHRSAQAFRRYDEQHLHLLAGEGRQEMTSFLSRVRATVADLEDTLQRDFAVDDQALADAAWDAESLRREFAPRP